MASQEANIGYKSETRWFYEFKVHLVVNEGGAILEALLTQASMNDLNPIKKEIKSASLQRNNRGSITNALPLRERSRALKATSTSWARLRTTISTKINVFAVLCAFQIDKMKIA